VRALLRAIWNTIVVARWSAKHSEGRRHRALRQSAVEHEHAHDKRRRGTGVLTLSAESAIAR
jgi:hypothetical protein